MEYTFDELGLKALYVMEKTSENLFLTGKAGTGKSTLLRAFMAKTTKNVALLAPTGVAALHIGGATIHSFFKFSVSTTLKEVNKSAKLHIGDPEYTELEMIIIDEVSMVRADLMDYIDVFLRIARQQLKVPFGGVQMVMIGDLFQLPPVVDKDSKGFIETEYESPYFFSSHVVNAKAFHFIYHELTHVYRQHDEGFIDFLNTVREGSCTSELLEKFNQKVAQNQVSLQPGDMYLAGRNLLVDQINLERLRALDGDFETYHAKIHGKVSESVYPTFAHLDLKVGAQVMFVMNHPQGEWANGTLGLVKKITSEFVVVKLFNGEVVTVTPHTWKITQYSYDYGSHKLESEVVGTFCQIPLKLAWACTIHKSQGKTFERVLIDLSGGMFAHGQTYVALSRCTSLQGIRLTRPLTMKDIIIDPVVFSFLEQAKTCTIDTL